MQAMSTLEIKFKDVELEVLGAKFTGLDTDATLSEEMSYEIERMWKDKGLQEVRLLARRSVMYPDLQIAR